MEVLSPRPALAVEGPGAEAQQDAPQLWAGFSSDKQGGAAAQKPGLQGAGHFSF